MKRLAVIAAIVISVLVFVGVRRVWGETMMWRLLVTSCLFAGAACVWEYKRRGRWEALAVAAWAILVAASSILARKAGTDSGNTYDILQLALILAGLGCLVAAAIGGHRRRSREQAAPSIPAENSEGS